MELSKKFIHSPRDPVIQHIISKHLGHVRNSTNAGESLYVYSEPCSVQREKKEFSSYNVETELY